MDYLQYRYLYMASTEKASSLLDPFYTKRVSYYKYKVKAPETNK